MAISLFAKDSYLQKPPIAKKINLAHEGVVADFEFVVTEYWIYYFGIRLGYPAGDAEERARVRGIIGGHQLDKRKIQWSLEF